jgi:3-oxoacyl-[acyl-carrier protein] reductase
VSLEGRVALVTGAGSGIGRAMAYVFAQRGCDVVIGDVSEDRAQRVAAEVAGLGVQALPLMADVADSGAVNEMVARALSELGRIDILVNNAGYDEECPTENMSDEMWSRMIAVHLDGCFYCCRAVIPTMKGLNKGKIVNISSISAMVAWGEQNAHYCAAKAGIMGFTKALAKELAPWKISVNAIAPGSTMTPIQDRVPQELIEARRKANPMGRFAQPEEIAYLAAFLASDEGDYITGQVISINGGAVIVGI